MQQRVVTVRRGDGCSEKLAASIAWLSLKCLGIEKTFCDHVNENIRNMNAVILRSAPLRASRRIAAGTWGPSFEARRQVRRAPQDDVGTRREQATAENS
jgi:hypothetical protein